MLDVIGQIGSDPGTEWGAGLTSTADNTLRRNATVCQGDPIGTDPFDPTVEWDGFAIDTIDGLGVHTANCDGDAAPAVTATAPANGAAGVARDADVAVTFSEPVNVAGAGSRSHCADTGLTRRPPAVGRRRSRSTRTSTSAPNERCTVTIVASGVTDQDGDDPPDDMAADASVSFTTVDTPTCGAPSRRSTTIQGSGGDVAPRRRAGVGRSIEGVVVGDYQGAGQFSGFYVQEEDADADADPATSEGIFVFNSSTPVAAGDVVRVRGNGRRVRAARRRLTELAA